VRGAGHDFGDYEQVFIKDGLVLLCSLGNGLAHVVGNFVLNYLELIELEAVGLKLLALGSLIVYPREE
jgi:hypothetical protein